MLRKIVDAFKVYFVLVVLLFTSVYLVYDSISGCLKYSLNKDAYTICNAQIIYRNDTMDWIKFEYDYHGERRKGEMSEGLLERKVNVIQVAVDESGRQEH